MVHAGFPHDFITICDTIGILCVSPFCLSPGHSSLAGQILSDVKVLGNVAPVRVWFDPSGRNSMSRPGTVQLDAGLFRNFRCRRKSIYSSAPNPSASPTPRASTPPGATVSALARNPDGSIRALNGYTEVLAASGEREIRFALKLFF